MILSWCLPNWGYATRTSRLQQQKNKKYFHLGSCLSWFSLSDSLIELCTIWDKAVGCAIFFFFSQEQSSFDLVPVLSLPVLTLMFLELFFSPPPPSSSFRLEKAPWPGYSFKICSRKPTPVPRSAVLIRRHSHWRSLIWYQMPAYFIRKALIIKLKGRKYGFLYDWFSPAHVWLCPSSQPPKKSSSTKQNTK